MSDIAVCIVFNGVRHVGGLYYSEIDFSIIKPDSGPDALGSIKEKTRRNLIPLNEGNIDSMAEYLIGQLTSSCRWERPRIVVDFDGRRILESTNSKNPMSYEGCCGDLFSYESVDQETVDGAVLMPVKD